MNTKPLETTDTAGLERADLLRFHHRNYIAQRLAWIALALFLTAALLGSFGGGGFFGKARASQGAIAVEYDRFARRGAHSTLTVRIDGAAVRAHELRLQWNREFMDGVRMESIAPPPRGAHGAGDGVAYAIAAQPNAPAVVRFHLQHEHLGTLPGRLTLEGGPSVAFTQFIYP